MAEFNVRSDSVNVEQIMEQIRARIREKRGVDYTEQQIRELAAVKLEKFLDPRVVRSDLLQQFQRTQAADVASSNVTFGPNAIFESPRPIVAKIRRLLRPVLRLFFNPDPISQALVRLGDIDPKADMYYEILHNLVIELTRTSIEVKNLKMRVESLTGRLEFNERRARALESVVAYAADESSNPASATGRVIPTEMNAGRRGGGIVGGARASGPGYGSSSARPHVSSRPDPSATPIAPGLSTQSAAPANTEQGSSAAPATTSPTGQTAEGPGQRSRRRRRRRGRRGGASAAVVMGAAAAEGTAEPSTSTEDNSVVESGGEGEEDVAPAETAGGGAEPNPATGDSTTATDAGQDPTGRPDSSGGQ